VGWLSIAMDGSGGRSYCLEPTSSAKFCSIFHNKTRKSVIMKEGPARVRKRACRAPGIKIGSRRQSGGESAKDLKETRCKFKLSGSHLMGARTRLDGGRQYNRRKWWGLGRIPDLGTACQRCYGPGTRRSPDRRSKWDQGYSGTGGAGPGERQRAVRGRLGVDRGWVGVGPDIQQEGRGKGLGTTRGAPMGGYGIARGVVMGWSGDSRMVHGQRHMVHGNQP